MGQLCVTWGLSALAILLEPVQDGPMATSGADVSDIELVRHKLKFLLLCRASTGWNLKEQLQYEELCRLERSLLQGTRRAA